MSAIKYLKLLVDYDKHCVRIAQATSINIHETADERAKRIKWLEADYIRWFEYHFPNFAKKKSAKFHAEMADLICKNKKLRALLEMFRSAGKSVHVDMGIPLYLYLAKKDLKFMLLIGETEPKAAQLLSGIQSQLQHNNRLKNDYGEKYSTGSWAEGDFTTTDGVKFMSLGFMQSPRGAREQAERPDYIAVDDVDNKRHFNNDRLMRDAVDFLTEDVWGCFDADDNSVERFVFANNNAHKNSITNRLKLYFNEVLEKRKERKEKSNCVFKVLTVCAVKNLSTFEPSWPSKTTAAYWRDKYENTPYRSFMREYMHVHIEDGAIFKYEDIVYTDVLPLKQYEALCFYGDLSYKAKGDFKAMILVGKTGRQFHIIISYVRQKSRTDVANWLYDIYEQHKLQGINIRYLIEGLFAMDEFTNDFDDEGDKRGYHIGVVADKRTKDDKHDRIESMSGYFEKRNVLFNIKHKTNQDQQTLIDQLLAFEKGSKAHDDAPDALQGAMSVVNMRAGKKKNKYVFGRRINNQF